MPSKVYDMAVKTGNYTDKNGETKASWENIGAVWKGDNGSYITLKRTFNPAGISADENASNILISLFQPKKGNY